MAATLEVKHDRTPSTSTSPGFVVHELSRQYSHPELSTYDERRREALKKIDQASLSRFHVRACLVSGIGFFTDAYDIFAINLAATMIAMVPHEANDLNGCKAAGSLSSGQVLGLKIATPIGTLAGQLVFGWLAHLLGRKRMYGVELTIIIIGTIAQAMAGRGETVSLFGALIAWRFLMGVGIGGDYPLSAVITSEFAATRIRGRMMTAVFSMQGFGIFTVALVSLIVTEAYKHQTNASDPDCTAIDHSWRLIIGLGAVPEVLALYFRLTIPETPRYTLDIERNVYQAMQDVNRYLETGDYDVEPEAFTHRVQAPKASWSDFTCYFGQWKNGKILFGAAYAWFALDIAYYGLGLNASVVLEQIRRDQSSGSTTTYQKFRNSSADNIIVCIGRLIPGYWATFFLIDSWGRKPIQIMGFSVLTIIFVCMDGPYPDMMDHNWAKKLLFSLYCLANFFQNFGPNTTTFAWRIISYPLPFDRTRYLGCFRNREHDDEISSMNMQILFIVFAVLMLTGLGATLLIEETKGRALEDLSNEKQDGFISGGPGPLELEPRESVVTEAHNQVPLGNQPRERYE